MQYATLVKAAHIFKSAYIKTWYITGMKMEIKHKF